MGTTLNVFFITSYEILKSFEQKFHLLLWNGMRWWTLINVHNEIFLECLKNYLEPFC